MQNEVIDIFELLYYLKKYDLTLITLEDHIDLFSKEGILFIKIYDTYNQKELIKEAVISKDWIDKHFIVIKKEVYTNAGTKKTLSC